MVGVATLPYWPWPSRLSTPVLTALTGLFQELSPLPVEGQELTNQSTARDHTIFTRPFIKQELLHDNLIQY